MKLDLIYTRQQNEIFWKLAPEDKFIVVTKGRRFGATQGGMQFVIEEALDGKANLWGDTINSNIDRYFERYGKPLLVKGGIPFNFNSQQKKLTFPFSDGYIDFRSADRPENWEGFGYHNIILNEAGIILKNDYLYTNAVLPMLIDHSDSRLFALGVPKGKQTKTGTEHKFYTLYRNALAQKKGYKLLSYTSYDNRFLNAEDVASLETEIRDMNPIMVMQEIYGHFVDESFDALWSPDMIHHVEKLPELKRVILGVDPSASKNGDKVGIIGGGLGYDGNVYIFSDRTGNFTPQGWGTVVSNEVKTIGADCIIAEKNQGGEMVEFVIRQYDKTSRIKLIHAFKGKELRAEPVVSLYERGKVIHLSGLNALENEMLTWIPGQGKSPNRVDAMVYVVMELVINMLTDFKTIPNFNNSRRF